MPTLLLLAGLAAAALHPAAAGAATEPAFSVDSGVYTNATITITISAPSGRIRFTLDGSVPTEQSPVYGGPITLGTNATIKAREFPLNQPPGDVSSRQYLFLDATTANFTSNLPLLVASTSGRPIPDNVPPGLPRQPGSVAVFDIERGRSALAGRAEFIGLAEFEIFGQTSAGFPKVPITIEIQDEFRNDRAVPLLGMPAEADWKLRTIYNDKTFLSEFLAFELYEQMGHYSVRRRFVEVFLDTSGGRIRYPQDYVGVMLLMERIERGADRVNITKLTPEDTAEPEITGGYVWKREKDSFGDLNFSTAGGNGFSGQNLKIHEPKPREITTNQVVWLRQHLNQFEGALYAPNWLTATGASHYSSFIDVPSFVDQHWIVEFTKNIDGYRLGNYMRKDRGGKIRMDLLWDWELSFGNADYLEGAKVAGWYWNQLGSTDHIWLRRLLYGSAGNVTSPAPHIGTGDPEFIQKIIDRWGELRKNVFSATRILARVDEMAGLLSEAAVRDFARYPRLGTYVWPNPNGPPNWDIDYVHPTTYPEIINELKKFILGRTAWIDSQFVRAPAFTRFGGTIPPGTRLGMTAPSGTIYYTLDGSDPRLPGGGVAPGARVYTGPLTIDRNTRVFARARARTDAYGWSPRAEVSMFVTTPSLRITEVMYQPPTPAPESGWTSRDLEYVELRNIGTAPLSLAGFQVSGGIAFRAASSDLAPGGRALIVANRAAFESVYGAGLPVLGEFSGALEDSGARLILEGPLTEPIHDFVYDPAWHPTTRGHGFSLVIANDQAPGAAWGTAAGWRASGAVNGSPGQPEPDLPLIPTIVINELLPCTGDAPGQIELRNLSGTDADISGWFLTDNFEQPRRFRLPDNTTIPAGGYRVLTEPTCGAILGGSSRYGSGRLGGELHLFSADASGGLTGYAHGVAYGPQQAGVSIGRHLTSDGGERFVAQTGATFGGPNSGPLVGPIVISEIHYRPPPFPAGFTFEDNLADEFVELFNPGAEAVPLFDPAHPENRWRLGGTVDFPFPPETTVAGGARMLIVGFNPGIDASRLVSFRNRYGVPPSTPVLGPYNGSLANGAGTLSLHRPEAPIVGGPDDGAVPSVLVERVRYSAAAPWPLAAAGAGFSLQRRVATAFADDVANWAGGPPTPGTPYRSGPAPSITVGPQSQSVIAPSPVAFNVVAGGAGPFRYQWRRDGEPIPGATNPVLTLAASRVTDSGRYQVVVMNSADSVVSVEATLTVLESILILEQPKGVTARVGTNVSLSVRAVGASSLRYQWQLGGANLPDATNATLALQTIRDEDAGFYSVVCTDESGSVSSDPAELIVLSPPVLVGPAPPVRVSATPGETLTLAAQLRGSLPIYCRWRLFRPDSGQVLTEQILTQHVASITFPVTTNSAGAYTVILTNRAGGILVAAYTNAILTVLSDADRDLLPDDYEIANGLRPNDPADGLPGADADGDGVGNRQEYTAGTDPRDAASYLKIDSIAKAGATTIQFGAVSNRSYTIQFSDSLAAGERRWRKLADIVASSVNRVTTVTDRFAGTNRFYRVVTPLQPAP